MTVSDYTTVVGVDRKHLQQLAWVWPTWKKHKPSLLDHPMIVFRDWTEIVTEGEVRRIVDHPDLIVIEWPVGYRYDYQLPGNSKWDNEQRYKMLAGFIHVPAMYVHTPYWLKIDTDTVATGCDDWIDPKWFEDLPAIVSQPWSFTKPADQMIKFDRWVDDNKTELPELNVSPRLGIIPKSGWSRVRHKRIISWCAFFRTDFTCDCADFASRTCKSYGLPEPSQDGYMWYVAKRLGLKIVRQGMKSFGWQHWSTDRNIRKYAEESLKDA